MSMHSREVRLGVVMFGGVSLAVYINGVSQELFRAVRGRGIYRLLKALTDSDVVVDVLSGASAGGINSVLLSAALCNGTDFERSAELWRKSADIAPLLSLTSDPPAPSCSAHPLDSVLDGPYLHDQMAEALAVLLGPPSSKRTQEDPSPVGELDLFVTATDIEGQKGSWVDAQGSRVELENHRALFWLKHRRDRNQPFASGAASDGSVGADACVPCSDDGRVRKANIEALASIAHITSCFPGAFRPVDVRIPVPCRASDDNEFADVESAVHARLNRWGNLARAGDGRPRRALYMDGGVLENKPFTSTIDAIFSRLASRPVTRHMLYIDPAPGDESREPRKASRDPDHARRLLPVALAAASGLPRFESIDGDLARIELHNQQVRRYEAIVRAATTAALANPRPLTDTNTPSASAYRRARVGGLAAAVIEAASPNPPSASSALPGQRPGISELSELIERTCQARDFSEVFARLDVLFGFRRLLHLTYLVDESASVTVDSRAFVHLSLPSKDGGATTFPIAQGLLAAINCQIELYEVLRARLETTVRAFITQLTPNWGDEQFWIRLGKHLDAVMKQLPRPQCFAGTATGVSAGSVTNGELKSLRGLRSTFDAKGSEASGPPFLLAAEEFERRLLAGEPKLLEVYDRFLQIDEVAHPLELVSELRGRDQIRTARISPLDATRGYASGFRKKLCGEQLGAFGAFFDASWRCNDLMWGRLDGTSQLIDLLFDSRRVESLDPALLAVTLGETLGPKFDLSSVFPNSPPTDREALERWLQDMCASDSDTVQQARAELAAGSRVRERLLRAAQLEILAEELPRLLEVSDAQRLALEPKGSLLERLAGLPEATPSAVASVAYQHFRPQSYQLSSQTLPSALPRERLRAYEKQAFAHLKHALLASLPRALLADTFRARALRKTIETGLNAAFWVVTALWHSGKLSHDAHINPVSSPNR